MPANAVSNREGRRCAKAKYYVRNIESLIPPLSLSRSLVPARQLVPNLFPEKFPFRLIILYGHRRCREMMHPTNLLISFSLSLSLSLVSFAIIGQGERRAAVSGPFFPTRPFPPVIHQNTVLFTRCAAHVVSWGKPGRKESLSCAPDAPELQFLYCDVALVFLSKFPLHF